jgi:hypothetical protein
MKTIKTIILVTAICLMNQFANAQIVYTDINPDITSASAYSLDLNNDGITDFSIVASNVNNANGYSSYVAAYGLNGNGVARSSPNSTYAKNFNGGTAIEASAVWASQSSLKTKYNYCQPFGGCSSGGSGSFGGGDGFLGLRLIANGQTYYGWARFKKVAVSNNNASFMIREYAYDSTPNHSIVAGVTSGARLTEEIFLEENIFSPVSYPNPLCKSATISFSLSESQKVSLKIFDVSGRLVSTLADKTFDAGENELVWNAAEVNAGIYFLRFQSGENMQTEKLIVTK